MAILAEMLHAASVHFDIVGGAVGMSRDVRRIVFARHVSELSSQIGQGDLVIYATLDDGSPSTDAHNRPLLTLFSAGVSAVLLDVKPQAAVTAAAHMSNTPLIVMSRGSLTHAFADAMQHVMVLQDSRLPQLQSHLQQEFSDLARAGADRIMILERLVEATGKSGLLQSRARLADDIRMAVRQNIDPATLPALMAATDRQAQAWIRETADPTVATVLQLELPERDLVRLVVPIWTDGWMQAALSLFARPCQVTTRDRVALLAAARVLGALGTDDAPEMPVFSTGQFISMATMAVCAPDHPPETVAELIAELPEIRKGGWMVRKTDVRAWLPCRSADQWSERIHEWHARLTSELGPTSIGHAFQRCRTRETLAAALIYAAEASVIGDRLFGPGHITSYVEAQLARLMLERADAADLSALFERTVRDLVAEDPRREDGLVRTLEVYCETVGTTRTAERLGVHRNTVQYRLRRIEEITATNLEDASTRLFLQIGLRADRLLRRSETRVRGFTDMLAGANSPGT